MVGLRLNSFFKLFEPELKQAQDNKKMTSKHLRIQTIYGKVLPKQNLWHANSVETEQSVLARQKEILSKQSRYDSIQEVRLAKNTLLVGFGYPAKFVFMFSFNIYYAAQEWDALKKQAAHKKTGIACYQPKYDDVACLKLVKPGNTQLCSYLVDSKMVEINPTRGWLLSPPDFETVCMENTKCRLG